MWPPPPLVSVLNLVGEEVEEEVEEVVVDEMAVKVVWMKHWPPLLPRVLARQRCSGEAARGVEATGAVGEVTMTLS